MRSLLRDKLLDVLKAVAPFIGVICVLQITLVQAPAGLFLQFIAGSGLAIVGLLILFVGIDLDILRMGRFIRAELSREPSARLRKLNFIPAPGARMRKGFGMQFVHSIPNQDGLIWDGGSLS